MTTQNPVIYPNLHQQFHSDRLGLQDSNMVQEVHGGYDTYASMMRPSSSYPTNMGGLGGLGYSPASAAFTSGGQQGMQYPDYYHQGNLQGAGGGDSWSSSMYPSTSISPPSTSRHSNLLDNEWPHAQTQYVGNVTVHPHEPTSHMQQRLQHVGGSPTPTGSGNGSAGSGGPYSGYHGSGCLPTMTADYGTSSATSGVTSGMTPTMTPSPTPGQVMGGSPPGGSGGNANRQSNRPPYDWMKKVAYPSTPSTVRSNELGSVGLDSIPSKTRTKDKYRVVYTDHQRLELEKEFHYSRYITIRRKAELAQALALSERQVKIWFQNRRAKERKQNKKRDEALGIKTERPDPMPMMSPLGGGGGAGMVESGGHQVAPQLVGHQGHVVGHMGQQGPQMTSLGGVGVGADMGGLQTGAGGNNQCHTPPMSTHSPPMSGHHS